MSHIQVQHAAFAAHPTKTQSPRYPSPVRVKRALISPEEGDNERPVSPSVKRIRKDDARILHKPQSESRNGKSVEMSSFDDRQLMMPELEIRAMEAKIRAEEFAKPKLASADKFRDVIKPKALSTQAMKSQPLPPTEWESHAPALASRMTCFFLYHGLSTRTRTTYKAYEDYFTKFCANRGETSFPISEKNLVKWISYRGSVGMRRNLAPMREDCVRQGIEALRSVHTDRGLSRACLGVSRYVDQVIAGACGIPDRYDRATLEKLKY